MEFEVNLDHPHLEEELDNLHLKFNVIWFICYIETNKVFEIILFN